VPGQVWLATIRGGGVMVSELLQTPLGITATFRVVAREVPQLVDFEQAQSALKRYSGQCRGISEQEAREWDPDLLPPDTSPFARAVRQVSAPRPSNPDPDPGAGVFISSLCYSVFGPNPHAEELSKIPMYKYRSIKDDYYVPLTLNGGLIPAAGEE